MGTNELDDLFDDAILDHCRHPRNPRPLAEAALQGRAVNPFCGDEVGLQLELKGRRVSQTGAQGVGCSINQAATSMLSDAVRGKTLHEIHQLAGLFRSMMRGDTLSEADLGRLGDLTALVGVRQFPVRIKCALLSLTALEQATAGSAD